MATNFTKMYSTGKPNVGDITCDLYNDVYRIDDGTDWQELPAYYDLDKDLDLRKAYADIMNKKNITNEYLESEYDDVKEAKEEYERLLDKYRIFEMIKQSKV